MRVPFFRKMSGINYPNTYATPEQIANAPSEDKKHAMYVFNCAQRAHYNFLENYTQALAAMLIGGLEHPVTSATLGAVWSVCRIVYAVGYTRSGNKHPSGRYAGAGAWCAQFGLFGLASKTGYNLLMA
jgi:glutathione S-transferase